MKKINLILMIAALLSIVMLVGCRDAELTSEDGMSTNVTSAPLPTDTTTTENTVSEAAKQFVFEGEYSPLLPKAEMPTKLYLANAPSDSQDLLTLVSLQGIMARNGTERIFIQYDTAASLFLNTVKSQYPDCSTGYVISVWSFLKKDPSRVSGYILTDLHDDSINVATSLAGHLNAIIVTYQNEAEAKKLGLECLLDVANKDDTWLRNSEYWQLLGKNVAFMHNPDNFENLRDYAIFCGAYMFTDQLSTQEEIIAKVSHMNSGFLILGWNTACGELDTVRALSQENGSIIAADYAKNLSTLSGLSLYSATQKTEQVEENKGNHHTVTIVISDGDNLQWALNTLPTSDKWFKNSARGEYAIGWGLPATLIDVASPALEYYYRTMKSNEEFIMQLSGIGYTFPSYWTNRLELMRMQKKLATAMARADMSVMEILDDVRLNQTIAETYYGGFLNETAVDGILYIDYSDYSCYNGQVFWAYDKPIVTARYRIWADYTNIESLANSINKASTNPRDTAAYSFIIVHAWSGLDQEGNVVKDGNTMDAVTALIEKLDDNVDVVTPSEFIRRITENVNH
ncbi:MAG: hypothetical protein IJW46_02285 [Clostridia bacterium]|nr:hypothetical protein [Clostridia bacterium]